MSQIIFRNTHTNPTAHPPKKIVFLDRMPLSVLFSQATQPVNHCTQQQDKKVLAFQVGFTVCCINCGVSTAGVAGGVSIKAELRCKVLTRNLAYNDK